MKPSHSRWSIPTKSITLKAGCCSGETITSTSCARLKEHKVQFYKVLRSKRQQLNFSNGVMYVFSEQLEKSRWEEEAL